MKSKKVKRLAIGTAVLAVFVAAVLGILAAMGINLFSCTKSTDAGEAPESLNMSQAAPTDGSLPTAHTGYENISYMVYVLDSQTTWHSYSETTSDASINHQMTYTYKDYKDGVLIASDMTSSSFVKSSTQTAYIGDGAYLRSGSKPTSTDITDIVWDDGEPEYLERQSYYEKYGLFADEISVFLLSEDTITSYGEVTDNGDGTYTQSFTLDPDASTYYYQFNMKTRGGLSSYPVFTAVNLTFTFNAQWEVLEITTYEVAKVSMGVINTTNTSESVITFTYGDDCIDEYNYSFYESYFKQYVGNVTEGGTASSEDEPLEVTEVLQYGFGEVLSGGKQYRIDVTLGDNAYTGYIYASVDLETLSEDTLGSMDIRLSLGKTLDDQMLYIELAGGDIAVYYSDSFAVSANLSELSLVIDQFSSFLNGGTDSGTQAVVSKGASDNKIALAKTATADEATESSDDVLTQILALFEVTETENGATLSLNTDDLLGTGIGISASLEFVKGSDDTLTFSGASVESVSYGGEELAVSVTLSDTAAEVITRNEEMTPASLADFVADVYDLLNAELLEISLNMDGASSDYSALDGLTVEATALLNINSVVVGADLYVSYRTSGGGISARISAYYNYSASEYGEIYLYLYEFEGKTVNVKLCCDITELVQAINVLLDGVDEDGTVSEEIEEVSQSAAQIINNLLALDISTVVTQLYAKGSEIRLGVDLDQIMVILGVDGVPALGTAALVYDNNNLSLSLAALGLTMNVAKSAGTVTEPEDAGNYYDLTALVTQIAELVNSPVLTAQISLKDSAISYLEGVELDGDISYVLESGLLEVSLSAGYQGITAELTAYYDGETVYINLTDLCGAKADVKIRGEISELSEMLGDALGDTSAELNIAIDDVLSAVLALDFAKIITDLEASAQSGVNISVDADELLAQLDVDLGIDLGVITLQCGAGGITATAASIGLTATIGGSSEEVTLPADAANYLNISEVAVNVTELINSKSIVVYLALEDSEISWLEGADVTATVKYTMESGALRVTARAEYQGLTAEFKVYYDDETVYLSISNICGASTSVKLKCTVEDLSSLLDSVLGGTSPQLASAADGVLETVFALDFGKIVTELKANAKDGVIIAADADALLSQLGVDLGVDLGEAEVSYGDTLEITADTLGLTATVSGASSAIILPSDLSGYLDLAAAVKDIYALVNSDIITVDVDFGGGQLLGSLVEGGYLDGVALSGSVSFATDGSAVLADLALSYAYGESETVSLGLQAFYDGTAVYLLIDEINGASASIGVSCTIETLSGALTEILALVEDGEEGEPEQAAADIVAVLLAMDYSNIIEEFTAYGTTLSVSVDVDRILSGLYAGGIISTDLSGMTFGSVALTYNLDGKLYLTAESLGLSAELGGKNGKLSVPAANYLSVESVLSLIQSVQDEAAAIEKAQALTFAVDCYVTADELTLGIKGSGEADWSNGVTVALDLDLSICDGSKNSDTVNVKLLYSAEGVTLVVDKLGITVTADDVSGLQEGFTQLLEAICSLAGISIDSQSTVSTVSALSGVDVSGEAESLLASGDLPVILTALLNIVSSTDWVEALSGLSLEADATGAALSYLGGYTLTFTADGSFALTSVDAGESGNENIITVTAGTSGIYADVQSEIASGEYTILDTESGAKLTEIIYNFGLGVISNASIAETLGTDTYEIAFTLTGGNSGVEALQGVTAAATLYYTELDAGDGTTNKLTELDVDIDADGVTVAVNVIYYEESLYLTLTNINGTNLNDLKLTIALEDVYDLADQLVGVLLDSNLVDMFSTDGVSAANEETGVEVTEEAATTISDTLVTLLTLDFNSIVGGASVTEDGVATRSVWVNIDEIYAAFADGETLGLGTVTASVITSTESGATTRAIAVTGEYNGAEWLSFTANRAEKRGYADETSAYYFDASSYWDLAFLNSFVADAIDFATDDSGEIYTLYTFSGDLTASVIGIDINIKVLNLTVGIDESNHIYVTLLGDLDYSSVIFLGTVTEDWLFGFNIAYSSEYGGYLVTCANNLGTTDAQYQVMTLNYLTDNLLKSNSCLKFMLGTSSTLWSTICSGLSAGGIELDSGIATPDEMYLTNSGSTLDTTESSVSSEFDITSIITGITAFIDGESYSCGTTNVSYGKLSSQIGSSDYYAIDLDNDTIDEYTGGGITEVYAAILRNSDGISGLVANGYIGGVMSFTLNLTYNEGVSTEYDLLSGEGTLVYEQAEAAESEFYAETTEESADGYYYVIDENGNYVYTNTFDDGSTLYTFSNDTYYIKNGDGTYSLATEYDGTAVYYVANYSSDLTGFYAPNLYSVVIANYGQELDYDRVSETEGSTNTFGCFTLTYDGAEWTGEYTDQTELYYFTLTVIYPEDSGIATQSYQLKYSSTIYANASDNTFANGDLYVYYIVTYAEDGSEILTPMGSSYTFTGDITVKAVLVEYQVTINGVVYTFDSDSNGYVITGVSGEGYSGSTLMLESEINGYEVKSISAGAFGSVFVSGGAYGSVTTIVLPESITMIGGRSFYACTNLQSVVCLADTITLETDGTTSGLGSDHGYPFYDCSSSLILYYTNLDNSVDSSKCFEYYESWWTYYPVGTVSSGWTYTGGEIVGCEDESLEEVIAGVLADYSGINVTADTEVIAAAVQSAVDAYTLENSGYVGYYRVKISATTEADGRYIVITATVGSGYGEYYLLEITSANGTVTINADDGDTHSYNGEIYVKAGASISLSVTANGGNRFTGFSDITGYDGTITAGEAFTMPDSKVTLTADYETYFTTLYIYSAVGFTYGGTEYGSGTVSISGEYTAASTLSTPVADGYTFLGWAYDKDGTLTFTDEKVITDTYYAIWGVSSQTVTDYTVATSGASLVTDLTSAGGTFYKWYADSAFTTEITAISTANTVVYARWQFSMDFNFSEGNSKLIVDGSTYASDTSTLTCTYSVSVLEGYYVTVVYSKGSYKYVLSTKYYTIVTVTVYDGEGGSAVESHTMYLNKADNNNGNRYLSISYISANWSGTTSGSDLTSGSAYATINGYTYISY